MKKILVAALFLLGLISAGPVLAQSPSAALSPYEELRYGQDLSRVPREPYQTEFELEGYKARPYIPPEQEPSVRSGAAARQRSYDSSSPAPSSPAGIRGQGLKNPRTKVRDRYQTRATWRNEQRKISERSRLSVPSAPVTPGSPASLGRPGAAQPAFPTNRR